VHLKYKSMLIV